VICQGDALYWAIVDSNFDNAETARLYPAWLKDNMPVLTANAADNGFSSEVFDSIHFNDDASVLPALSLCTLLRDITDRGDEIVGIDVLLQSSSGGLRELKPESVPKFAQILKSIARRAGIDGAEVRVLTVRFSALISPRALHWVLLRR
jgi:hypothetical protein